MNFNSFPYLLLFLPIVLILVAIARKLPIPRAPQVVVFLASMFFYTWSKPANLAYLLGSILVNWQLSQWIVATQGPARKRLLQLALVLNIGFLCLFKYVNFLLSSIPWLTAHHIRIPDLAFPLGISFFTLAQIMYIVDCYQETSAPSSLFDHATFVSFFPYVISGPIAKARRILHQFPALNAPTGPSADTVARAMYLFSMGLIKKVVLADAFSQAADFGFTSARNMSMLEAWVFVSCYTLQIYVDFSGYSDMAIASAHFLGIDIPRNFDAPLRSTSIIEFWTRWHISLSEFITSYLYTPILKSFEKATLQTSAIATLIAMSIAGLWHGPSWTFVIFGFIHGAALVINQYWKKLFKKKKGKKSIVVPDWLCWFLTFGVVDLAFVFFRAGTLSAAMLYLPHLVNMHNLLGTHNLGDMNGAGLMVIDLPTRSGLRNSLRLHRQVVRAASRQLQTHHPQLHRNRRIHANRPAIPKLQHLQTVRLLRLLASGPTSIPHLAVILAKPESQYFAVALAFTSHYPLPFRGLR